MELSKYINKVIKVDLSNGFYYVGKVISVDKDSIEILDKKGLNVSIKINFILFIREVNE
ncbi:MAG: hypothetical protein ACP6IY_20980 [Promethearchaeia archaeon]